MDAGEAEAIALAEELDADVLLVDEIEARQLALTRGLSVAGTIGILELAAEQSLLDLRQAFERLTKTNMHVHPDLMKQALARDLKKRQGS